MYAPNIPVAGQFRGFEFLWFGKPKSFCGFIFSWYKIIYSNHLARATYIANIQQVSWIMKSQNLNYSKPYEN